MLTPRNKSDTLQETSVRQTPNDKDENFMTAHIIAAVECIPTKTRPKCKVSWEAITIREKRYNCEKPFLLNKRNAVNACA